MGGGKTFIIKRITSLKTNFLLLFFLCAIPLISRAQIIVNYQCFQYEYNHDSTNTVTLKGFAPSTSLVDTTNLVIPNSFKEYNLTWTVTRISDTLFRGNTAIQTVQLPKTLKTIDQATFQGCTGLTTVTFYDDGMSLF